MFEKAFISIFLCGQSQVKICITTSKKKLPFLFSFEQEKVTIDARGTTIQRPARL